jgi:hypothetical protein
MSVTTKTSARSGKQEWNTNERYFERAKELERARMKEEEVQKLLEEAEGLKNK